MSALITRERVALTLFLLAVFVAVVIGTYAALTAMYPPNPLVRVEVCLPEHDIMPEDLGRTDGNRPPPSCGGGGPVEPFGR